MHCIKYDKSITDFSEIGKQKVEKCAEKNEFENLKFHPDELFEYFCFLVWRHLGPKSSNSSKVPKWWLQQPVSKSWGSC